MRILVAHNRYQQRGGEDAVFENETAMLEEAGHEVHRYEVHNDHIASLPEKARTFLTAPYSRKAHKKFSDALRKIDPDVVHVHNYFPLLTPAVFYACAEQDMPVVHTLHNFRMMCANGLLLRDGQICKKCVSGSPFWAVAHRCYRDSYAGSLAVARMINAQRRWGTWHETVTRFIALTRFERKTFIEAGIPDDKICIKPNFIPDPAVHNDVPPRERSGALFVGRLSEEKGLRTLLEAWREIAIPLRIAGDGPLLDEIRASAPANVTVLGRLQSEQIYSEMSRAALLMMPSNWYEGFPVTLVEAFACGLPVAASRIGSLQELVKDGRNGVSFEPGNADDLAATVRRAFSQPDRLAQMTAAARACYDDGYTIGRNIEMLESVYHDACAAMSSSARSSSSRNAAFGGWSGRTAPSEG